jgi:hypothetical protein
MVKLMAPRTAMLLAALPLALLAVALVMGSLETKERPVALMAGRSSHPMLLQQQRFVRGARKQMLEEEAGKEEGGKGTDCVSWRGCSQRYDPKTMDIHAKSFYDRFDNYPTAWDPSPAARYVRDLYPTGWPAFVGEEPAVIVGGDPTKAYPFTSFGTPYDGVYDEYRSPYTYSY